jgi:hypothetical protein
MTIDHSIKSLLLEIQETAIIIAEAVFQEIEIGMTEKDAAHLLTLKAKEYGVEKYFHHPFAWFGDRTMFKDFTQPLPILSKSTWKTLKWPNGHNKLPHFGKEFMPSERKLTHNTAVILDLAPMKNHVFADIGYSNYFGKNADHDLMMVFLKKLKDSIPEIISQEKSIDKIYHSIDDMIKDNGFINCHQKYPLGVLGHKVGHYPKIPFPTSKINLMGFSPEAFIFLLEKNISAPFYYTKHTPYLAGHINQNISDGYWAIEPHIGINNMGAKFEEILVIDSENEKDVYWLSSN